MKKNILIITIAIAAGFVACKHHPDPADLLGGGGGGGTDPLPWVNPDPCDPDTVYFTNTIAPLLNAYCGSSDCHDNVNPEEDINVTSYSAIMNSDGGEFVVRPPFIDYNNKYYYRFFATCILSSGISLYIHR